MRLLTWVLVLSLSTTLLFPTVPAEVNDERASEQWAWTLIRADETYEAGYRGQGMVVAILDSGIDLNHEDLKDNLWRNEPECSGLPFVDDDSNGYVDDCHGFDFVNVDGEPEDVEGHGTKVAGIAAAVANNSVGIVGVAPESKLMILKVIRNNSVVSVALERALKYALDMGANVVSMSFGGSSRLSPVAERTISDLYASGVVLVASAGNENNDTKQYPAAYDEVIAVSAVNRLDQKADYSNYGDWIELAAPGGDPGSPVLTTYFDGYWYGWGTSIAAPHVAGVAALVMAASGGTPDEVREAMRISAVDLGDPGKDPEYGYGRVDAVGAIQYLTDSPPTVRIVNPGEFEYVQGMQQVVVTVDDDYGVVRVEFYLDGVLRHTDISPPFEWWWDTTKEENGPKTITVVAYDTSDQEGTDQVVVHVDNEEAENWPPVCIITHPADGDTVYGLVQISGDAWDPDGQVKRVEVRVDMGEWMEADGTTEWSIFHDFTQEGYGPHTIECRAFDGHNYSDGYSISVSVPLVWDNSVERSISPLVIGIILGVWVAALVTVAAILLVMRRMDRGKKQ